MLVEAIGLSSRAGQTVEQVGWPHGRLCNVGLAERDLVRVWVRTPSLPAEHFGAFVILAEAVVEWRRRVTARVLPQDAGRRPVG